MIEFGLTPNHIFKYLTYQRNDFEEIENKNCRYQICNSYNNYTNEDCEINVINNNNNFISNDFQYIKIIEVPYYKVKYLLFV